MTRHALTLGLAVLALAASALASGCARQSGGAKPGEPTPEQQLRTLAPSQVDNYKGEKLGSITDFRENSIEGPQQVDVATYRLKVDGRVEKPLSLTYQQVLQLPKYRKVVTVNCIEGWSVRVLVDGVKLTDLLEDAGYDADSKVLIFRAADGYSSSLPLAYVRDRDILLAYRMNGVVLPQARGFPFEVIAEDKWGYKWVKWVEEIEVSNDTSFRGYWESRGYDNDATLPSKR
ncbi:MAG: molybdopterin-dependent oxidoreductase [Coriobacteriales bacterium]|nr:molybdopterin-dependent oxidoreductase [Coriobacteriales bacterium]